MNAIEGECRRCELEFTVESCGDVDLTDPPALVCPVCDGTVSMFQVGEPAAYDPT